MLHRSDLPLARYGPFEPARRYWRGNAPEHDRRRPLGRRPASARGRGQVVGPSRGGRREGGCERRNPGPAWNGGESKRCTRSSSPMRRMPERGTEVVDARTVMGLLR